MKKCLPFLTALTGAAALQNASAIDITVSDPHNDKSFAPLNQNLGPNGPEDNTVQYNAIANQSWDLESFSLDGSNLTITGGFNFLTGQGYYDGGGGTLGDLVATPYPLGDIFVYLGTDAPYTLASPGTTSAAGISLTAWDYVIHFDRDANRNVNDVVNGDGSISVGYTILSNTGQAIDLTGGSGSLITGLPWQTSTDYAPDATASYTTSNDVQGFHNSISGIDISSILDGGQSFYLHTALKCGNDVLWGQASVPDGGAALGLLGLGVGALGLVRRRLR